MGNWHSNNTAKTTCLGTFAQAFALSKFIAIAGLGVHLHLASDLKQKIVWPRSDGAMRSKLEQRHHVVEVCI
jgi:hypothetical protein